MASPPIEVATEEAGAALAPLHPVRPTGGLPRPAWTGLAALLVALGTASMLWTGSFLPEHQKLLGVPLIGAGLLGLVFANARGTFHDVVARHRLEIGSILLITGYALGVAFLWEKPGMEGIAVMGLVLLATTLVGGNVLSGRTSLSKDEVGNAIALSTVSMFFAMVGFADEEDIPDGVLSDAIEHFWQVLIAVVGFYFAKGAAEAFAGRGRPPAAKGPAAEAQPPAKGP